MMSGEQIPEMAAVWGRYSTASNVLIRVVGVSLKIDRPSLTYSTLRIAC